MKKIFFNIAMLCFAHTALALPLGNPSDPHLYPCGILDDYLECPFFSHLIRLGFYGDYVFERHLETEASHAAIRHTQIYTNAGLIDLNLWDRLDIFTTLGTTAISFNTVGSALNATFLPLNVTYFDLDTAFSWSVGARALILGFQQMMLGAEFQYFACNTHFNAARKDTFLPVYLDNISVHYKEWQAGLGISYERWVSDSGLSCIPYIGIKYSRARLDMTTQNVIINFGTTRFQDLQSSRKVGYAVGVSVFTQSSISINVEGCFRDERALAVNAQLAF